MPANWAVEPEDLGRLLLRRGTSFLIAGTVGGNQEIITNPGTWQFQGYQFLGDGRDAQSPGAWGMAVLRKAHVSAPGTRPPEQHAPSNV